MKELERLVDALKLIPSNSQNEQSAVNHIIRLVELYNENNALLEKKESLLKRTEKRETELRCLFEMLVKMNASAKENLCALKKAFVNSQEAKIRAFKLYINNFTQEMFGSIRDTENTHGNNRRNPLEKALKSAFKSEKKFCDQHLEGETQIKQNLLRIEEIKKEMCDAIELKKEIQQCLAKLKENRPFIISSALNSIRYSVTSDSGKVIQLINALKSELEKEQLKNNESFSSCFFRPQFGVNSKLPDQKVFQRKFN